MSKYTLEAHKLFMHWDMPECHVIYQNAEVGKKINGIDFVISCLGHEAAYIA